MADRLREHAQLAASSAQVLQMDPPPGTMAAERSGTLLKLKFYIGYSFGWGSVGIKKQKHQQ